ncbi:MAG: RsmE family RNA methyltransferase [Gemmatimonadota bacterium]
MSSPTLFAPPLEGRRPGDTVELEHEEARHLEVLRLVPGDSLVLTDGRGSRWSARLEPESRACCTLLSALESPSPLPAELAFALAGKARTLWLVEKAAELGTRRLCPVVFARSRSVADAARSPAFWQKAERRAVSALKQSGGAWLPEIAEPVGLTRYLHEVGISADTPRVLLDAAGAPLRTLLSDWSGGVARFLIGPEGGLEPAEIEACERAGFRRARLGGRTMRFETAAIACLAATALHVDEAAWHGPIRGGGAS